MPTLSDYIVEAVVSVLVALVMSGLYLIGVQLHEYLKARKIGPMLDVVDGLLHNLILVAETQIVGQGRGSERREWVIAEAERFLQSVGLKVSPKIIDYTLEAIIANFKNINPATPEPEVVKPKPKITSRAKL